jgi:phosphatidylglycerophosphate synthase
MGRWHDCCFCIALSGSHSPQVLSVLMFDTLSHAHSTPREARWTYPATLKDPTVEEWINLHLHRRVAFALIRPLQGRAEWLHPNHVTLLSGMFGVGAAIACYLAAESGRGLLALGALLLMASAVLDCADGMLARLRGQSSEFGRLLDGLVDQVVGLGVWYGLSQTISARVELAGLWWYSGFALLSVLVHVALYDQHKIAFDRLTSSKRATPRQTAEGTVFERAAGALHRRVYGAIMRASGGRDAAAVRCDPVRARRELSPPMRSLTVLGLGTQFFVLYSAMLLGAVTDVAVTFVVAQLGLSVLLNGWTVVALRRWQRAMTRLQSHAEAS